MWLRAFFLAQNLGSKRMGNRPLRWRSSGIVGGQYRGLRNSRNSVYSRGGQQWHILGKGALLLGG